jgi:hypothetical protein
MACFQESGDNNRAIQDVLAVVQHNEDALICHETLNSLEERLRPCVPDSKRLSDN